MRSRLRTLALLLGLLPMVVAVPAHAGLRHYLSRLIFPIQVTTEYDRDARLAQPVTYSWGDVHMALPQYEPVVRAAVDADLKKRGWQLVPSGGAVTLFALGDMQGVPSLKAFYQQHAGDWAGNWGEHGWGAGWKPYHGEMVSTAVSVPGNNLVLDMFNTADRKPLFRSVAAEQLWNDEKANISYLNDSVKKMLKKLPR